MLPDTRFKNYRILVVDDEQRMAKFIRLNLEHDGFRVGVDLFFLCVDPLKDLSVHDLGYRHAGGRQGLPSAIPLYRQVEQAYRQD